MIRAVVDTNVLVSGLLSPLGNEALIILAIHQGRLCPCFTEVIVAEYTEVLARPKFSFPPDEVAALIAMFRRAGEVFNSEAAPAASPIRATPNSCNARTLPRPTSSSPGTSGIFRTRRTAQRTS